MPLHISSITRLSLHGSCHFKPNNAFSLLETHICLTPTSQWFCFHLSSVGSYQKGSSNKCARALSTHESLPWIGGHGDKTVKAMETVGAPKQPGKKLSGSISSSWNEAADNYFAKHQGTRFDHKFENSYKTFDRSTKEGQTINKYRPNVEDDCPRVEDGEDEEDCEPVNDERWKNIKKNYRKLVETDERIRPKRAYEEKNIPWDHKEEWGKRTWKEVTGSSPPKMVGEAVYGVGPVLAALTIGRREFYALYVQEGLDLSSKNKKKKDKGGIGQVLQMAGNLGLTVKEVSKHDLNMLVDCRPHQGLVLDASPLEMVNITELESVSSYEGVASSPLWIALDEVTDPQNFGAVVRSAYFFGATGVVVCAKNSAPLSGVVSKASAGSLELTELRSCRNMMKFLELSARNGWRVLGASVSQEAVSLNAVSPGVPTILVLGSEGRGLRPLVSRSCSQLISIPGTLSRTAITPAGMGSREDQCETEEFNTFMAVESLNVSVAAGILIYHLIGSSGRASDTKISVPME